MPKAGDIKKEYSALNFKPLKNEKCNDCHFDIHKGELKKKTCTDCHTTEGWEKKTFEHNNAEFSDFTLKGKHEKVTCDLCHLVNIQNILGLIHQCQGMNGDGGCF